MRPVLLTFGDRLEVHLQAAFCIVSFLKADLTLRPLVVTDRPQLYAHFGVAIELLQIGAKLIHTWQQPSGFFWRIKICALQAAAEACVGENLLYVDADTIFVGGLERLRRELDAGRTLMHVSEHRLCQAATRTERQNWRALRGGSFGGLTVDSNTTMWNAGVIGIPATKARASLAQTLIACDEMCATPARRRLLEQLAFSLVLQATGPLADARREVLHYWGNKDGWQRAIDAFWLRSRLEGRSLAQDIDAFELAEHTKRPVEHRPRRLARWLRQLADARGPGRERYFDQ